MPIWDSANLSYAAPQYCPTGYYCLGYSYNNTVSKIQYNQCSEKISNSGFDDDMEALMKQLPSACFIGTGSSKGFVRYAMAINGYKINYTSINEDYECLKYKTEKYTYTTQVMTSPAKPAECDDSYDGVSFGAGGGGGAASDTLGVFGKGGKGAYGAVIVEW